jgi:hypothetical protein
MRTTPIAARPAADPDALIREARRRQRIRYLLTAVAGLAALGSGAGLYVSQHGTVRPPHHAPTPRPSPARSQQAGPAPIPPLAVKVLMWPLGLPLGVGNYSGPPFVVDDLRTGHYVQTGKVNLCCGDYQPLMITTGRWLVYVGAGATAIRADLTGRRRVLGPTSFFAPSASKGEVWLAYLARPAASIRLVAVTGRLRGPLIRLPRRSQLVAGTDAGLLLQDQRGMLRLWRPGTTPRRLPYSPAWGDGFGVTPGLIAYGTGCRDAAIPADAVFEPTAGYRACSVLRVLQLRTGRVVSFRAPAGTTGWVPPEFGLENPISTSGSMIAAESVVPSAGDDRGRLYVLRLTGRSGRTVPVPSSAGYLFSKVAWSPGGSWLFYQGPGFKLWGYRVSTGAVRASSVPCCLVTVMAAVPAG